MSLTDAQYTAIHNHADNLIVIAGAGSGKTYVLVRRYLALLDRNPDWALNALVAITFTQKAAQEMRDRVRQHLQQQADADPDTERWANRLAAMDSARIDTIHGLCASILRANAAAANVDPAFTVLDEIEMRVLIDRAIDDVLRTLNWGIRCWNCSPSTASARSVRRCARWLPSICRTAIYSPCGRINGANAAEVELGRFGLRCAEFGAGQLVGGHP